MYGEGEMNEKRNCNKGISEEQKQSNRNRVWARHTITV